MKMILKKSKKVTAMLLAMVMLVSIMAISVSAASVSVIGTTAAFNNNAVNYAYGEWRTVQLSGIPSNFQLSAPLTGNCGVITGACLEITINGTYLGDVWFSFPNGYTQNGNSFYANAVAAFSISNIPLNATLGYRLYAGRQVPSTAGVSSLSLGNGTLTYSSYTDTYTTAVSTSAIGISPWDKYSLGFSDGSYAGIDLTNYSFPNGARVYGNGSVTISGTLSNPSSSNVYLQIRPAGSSTWYQSTNSTNYSGSFTFTFNLPIPYSVNQKWEHRLYRPTANDDGLSFYNRTWAFNYQY